MSKAFFTNSGTEAIEGALKAAKKYAYVRDGHADHEIIAMNHSFHGRSIGALSVTGTAHYREPFEPLMGGVKFADFNDLESVKVQITDKTSIINKENDILLRSISIDSHDGLFSGMMTVMVDDTSKLESLVKKIKTVKGVKQVNRG